MPEPLRVMHLITSLTVGGAETMLLKLVSHSDRNRFGHRIVSMVPNGALAENFRALGIPVEFLGMTAGQPSLQGALQFLDLIRREKPDIIQTWLYHADLLGVLSRLITRAPLVWNIRSAYNLGLNSMTVKLCALFSKVPVAVIYNSNAGRLVYTEVGYKPRRWTYIPNGFDLGVFKSDPPARVSVRQELGLSPDAILIGLVGRYDPLKRHNDFLKAAGLMAKTNPDIYFVMAGEGVNFENPKLKSIVSEESLAGRVFLLGRRMDIPRLTASLDIATCCSIGEAFPNVVGEAMACEIPCVVTDVGDSARILNGHGVIVSPQDPSALVTGWKQLLDSGIENRQRIGRSARQEIELHFELSSIVKQYEELYFGLCQRRQIS